jgi:predicted SprT family Zn-dependent metalloprotease
MMSRKSHRSYEQKIKPPVTATPTEAEYTGFQRLFDHLNRELFGGMLPQPFITLRARANSAGYFAPDRFSGRVDKIERHEIALNADVFIGRTDEQIASTLLHEMTHLWQRVFGKPASRGYHNREWSLKMRTVGLWPSSTAAVGGHETGQHMSHYIVDDGPFQKAFRKLVATGWKLNLQSTVMAGGERSPPSKVKFTCRKCQQNAWGKPHLKISCTPCEIPMLPAE